jgi:hypothetical protein
MGTISTLADIAGILCLPATIASLPGFAMMFSVKARAFITERRYIPYILVLIVVAIWAIDASSRLGAFKPSYVDVYNRTFSNETVKLDGHKFFNCTFINVMFLWEGRDYGIFQSRFVGRVGLKTSNRTIYYTSELLRNLNMMKETIEPYWLPRGEWELWLPPTNDAQR